MATDVLTPFAKDSNAFAEATPDEIQDFQKIIKLRNDVLAGTHPRFKPPLSWQPLAQPDASGGLARRPSEPTSTVGGIDDVLLAKSDVLIKAETSFKRQRIEKELKQQVEQRKIDMRLGLEVRDGKVIGEEDIDLDDALKKADIWTGPIDRPDDPSSVERLHPFFGEDEQVVDRRREPTDGRPGQYVPPPPLPEYRPPPSDYRIPPQSAITPLPSRGAEGATVQGRDAGFQVGAPPLRDGRPPASDALRQALDDASQQPDRTNSPQPRFSATSHVRTPIAPQPLRQANMARVESQDHLVEVESNSVGGFSDRRRSLPPPPTPRDRGSPRPVIKPEPSPYPRDGFARRPLSPGRGPPRPGSPVRDYYGRPPDIYDQRPPPPRDYHYAAPPPPLVPPVARHPYDYPYRDPPPFPHYQPPSVEYRRPYPTQYPPMPPAQEYYPPRPAYEDYAAERYGSRPPPPMRRSASPAVRGRPRRESRSVSPQNERRRRSPSAAADRERERDRHERALTRPPPGTAAASTPVPRDDRQTVPHPHRAAEPYPHDYPSPYVPPPRERVTYYEPRDPRDPYYLPPPPPRYVDEPMGRAESGVVPRDDYRGYRERDYLPPAHRQHPAGPPPPPPVYPPDYRSASRAAVNPPMARQEYPPPPHYAGGGERPYARQQSVRPPEEYYGDVAYHRTPSVRPMGERERYEMGGPPLPPPPPPGYRY